MVTERKNGVQKKKTDKSGLGRAIINRRAKQAKIAADPTLVSFTSFRISQSAMNREKFLAMVLRQNLETFTSNTTFFFDYFPLTFNDEKPLAHL